MIQNNRLKIYGSGTLSGETITHPNYVKGYSKDVNQAEYKSISIEDHDDTLIEGICVVDPANHTIKLTGSKMSFGDKRTTVRWAKIISWRANGDGIGSASLVEDCFIRTNDDNSYIKGDRRRCVFWQERGAAVFHMAGIYDRKILIEDCDVIYNRSRGDGQGGVFVQRGEGKVGIQKVDVTVRNFRVTDPRPNAATFRLMSEEGGRHGIGSSYQGLVFQNVVQTHPIVGGQKNRIIGCKEAPWKGGVTFENVTVAGNRLTSIKRLANQRIRFRYHF